VLNKKEKGKITISFEEKGNKVECSIEDDGVGREFAMHKKKDLKIEHKSYGVLIAKERLETINQLMGVDYKIEIIDLKNEEGKATGTKVALNIPFS